jgi:inner membrane protein
MASAFSHAFIAIALGKAYSPQPMPWRFWGLSVLCSVLPDADVLGLALGIHYGAMLGHRGLSHSLGFAAVVGFSVAWFACRDFAQHPKTRWALGLYFAAVTASHGLLDAITNGGLGIAFFAPFDTTRYFLPWRPVRVSPISVTAFFSSRGLRILQSEIVHIWLPAGLLCGLIYLLRRPRLPLLSPLPGEQHETIRRK